MLAIVLSVAEALTAQLVTIWFALGALAAMVATLLGAGTAVQVAVFAVVSVASLIATRPLVKKYVNKGKVPTNADMVIGQDALVLEAIDNVAAQGLVSVKGAKWTARSADGSVIEKDSLVTVEKIEGVKVIVTPKST